MNDNCDGLLEAFHQNIEASEKLLAGENDRASYRKLDTQFHNLPFQFARNPCMSREYGVIAAKVWAMSNRLRFPPRSCCFYTEPYPEFVR